MSILEALDKGDLSRARDLILDEIYAEVGDNWSEHSPNYDYKVYQIQKSIVQNLHNDKLLTYFGLETLRDRYFLKTSEGKICEAPQDFFARVAAGLVDTESDSAKEDAQNLYNIISTLKFMPATPILANAGTNRGLTISCYLTEVEDSIVGIFDSFKECAVLSKGGGGLGVNFSKVRGLNATINGTGKSTGTIPFMKTLDSSTLAISQGGIRRASAATFLDITHPDIEEFINIRRPTGGDDNRRCLNLHHGVNITDSFMKAVKDRTTIDLVCPRTGEVTKTVDAHDLWIKILKNRFETGEPYITYIDTVNRYALQSHKERGLQINQTNLCSEILLPTDSQHTAVCCLGSINLEQVEDDEIEYVTGLAVQALDQNLTHFIQDTDGVVGYEKARRSAMKERSIGLGLMGWHGYLMKNSIPFDSPMAIGLAKSIQKRIKESATIATTWLAAELGDCEYNSGYRNSYMTAIAPTANISIIAGNCTPCIEPIVGNAYLQKTLSGSFIVKNKYLEILLKSLDKNTVDVWTDITVNKGSVQHLDFLTPEQKRLFATAYEIDQRVIIRQAAARQEYLCQSQSLNLFFALDESGNIDGNYLKEVHHMAWANDVKTLYYLRSEKASRINMQEGCQSCQ